MSTLKQEVLVWFITKLLFKNKSFILIIFCHGTADWSLFYKLLDFVDRIVTHDKQIILPREH